MIFWCDLVIRWFVSWRHGSISISPSFHWLCSRASSLSAWASNETSVWNVVTSWRRSKLWAVKFPSTKALQIHWCTTPAGTSTQTYTKRKDDFAMPCRPMYLYFPSFSVLNHALRRGPWSFQPPHTSASSPGSPAVLTIPSCNEAGDCDCVTVPCLDLSQVQQVTAPAGCPESTNDTWKMTIWIYGIWRKMILKKKRRRKDLQFFKTSKNNGMPCLGSTSRRSFSKCTSIGRLAREWLSTHVYHIKM